MARYWKNKRYFKYETLKKDGLVLDGIVLK